MGRPTESGTSATFCLLTPSAIFSDRKSGLRADAMAQSRDATTTDLFDEHIVFQSMGFYVMPFLTQSFFTAKSPDAVRHTQAVMPLYLLMCPLLVLVAYYALTQRLQMSSPGEAFFAVVVRLLPDWLIGVVAARRYVVRDVCAMHPRPPYGWLRASARSPLAATRDSKPTARHFRFASNSIRNTYATHRHAKPGRKDTIAGAPCRTHRR